MSKITFFDVDGTLIPRTSSERIFIEHLLSKCAIPARNIFGTIFFLLKNFGDIWHKGIHENKQYLYGLRHCDVLRYASECLPRLYSCISVDGATEIKKLLSCRSHVVLLSAGPDFLTKCLADKLGVQNSLATSFEVKEGLYTGNISGLQPYGKAKASVALEYARRHGVALKDCAAYANATSDRYLLSAVGTQIAVNPSHAIRKIAERQGWRILFFS